MPKLAAAPAGSEVDPCCCQHCTDIFDADLECTVSGVSPCSGVSFSGINGNFTAVSLGGGNWQVLVGTVDGNDAYLDILCDGTTGNLFIAINIPGLSGSAYSSGPTSVPFDTANPNTNTCGVFEYGIGGTVTVTYP